MAQVIYALADPALPSEQELAQHLRGTGYALQALGPSTLRQHFYDDAQSRLEQRGLWLYRQSANGTVSAALTRLGGEADMTSGVSAPLGPGEVWPAAIRRRLDDLLGPDDLRPRLELTLTRDHYALSGEAGRCELALLSVEAQRPNRSQRVQFCELELEANGINPDDIAQLLSPLLKLNPHPAPRAQRAEVLLGLAEGFDVEDGGAGDA